jgi:uncharacterized protein YegJ (DUF2314 family)
VCYPLLSGGSDLYEPVEWRHVYDVWTAKPDPPDLNDVIRGLPDWTDELRVVNRQATDPWWVLWMVDDLDHPLVRLEHAQGQWDPDEDATDSEPDAELERVLQAARSRYLLSVTDHADNAVYPLQLALALGLAILNLREGVLHDLSALRMVDIATLERLLASDDLAIEDHVTLHLVTEETTHRAWLHSHGMEKFGRSNLETFDLDVTAGRDAGKLINELLLSASLGTRPLLGETISLPGGGVKALPSGDLRPGITTLPIQEFDGHTGPYLCLVDADTYGDITGAVEGYLHRSLVGIADRKEEAEVTRRLLPLVRNHFSVNATSEDYEYFAKIPMDVQSGESTAQESIWVRITRWQDNGLRGTLASDSVIDAQLQVGTEVEFEPEDIEAIMLSVSGKPVGGRNLESILQPAML